MRDAHLSTLAVLATSMTELTTTSMARAVGWTPQEGPVLDAALKRMQRTINEIDEMLPGRLVKRPQAGGGVRGGGTGYRLKDPEAWARAIGLEAS